MEGRVKTRAPEGSTAVGEEGEDRAAGLAEGQSAKG